ncbi:MAG TPA: hypothetical protein VFB78_07610 [Acidimicrobiales bacterium]|nr:hypothetical protein [Acidimicrobiales bacterium]
MSATDPIRDPEPDGDDDDDTVNLWSAYNPPASAWPQHSNDADDPAYDSEVARFETHVGPGVVKDHGPRIEAAERAISKPMAQEAANRATVDACTAAVVHALTDANDARNDHQFAKAHPDTNETRRTSTGVLVGASLVVTAVMFLIDRVLLRSVFFTDSIGMVTAVAAIVGGIQATSAHLAGKHDKHVKFAAGHRMDRTVGTHRAVRAWASRIGVGSELILGVLRARATGQFLSSALLVCGGLIMWILIASLSWAHACHSADRVSRAKRAVKASNARRLAALKSQIRSAKALVVAQENYMGAVADAVADWKAQARALNAHLVSVGKRAFTPAPPSKVAGWIGLLETGLPLHLTLPSYRAPSVAPESYYAEQRTTRPAGPLALGPGAG